MAALLIVFVLVALSVVGLLHWYLWARLVRDTTRRRSAARRAGTATMIALAALVPATLVGSRALPPSQAAWLAWPGYVWLALFFYLLVTLLLLELPRAVALRAMRRQEQVAVAAARPAETPAPAPAGPGDAPPLSRRVFIGRTTAAVAGVAAAGLVGYGATSALGSPRVRDVTVALRRLSAAADGMRIAVVSDIHLGPLRGRSHAERIVRLINEQDVDIVAIVGDLVDGTVDELGDAAAPLRDLVSRHGAYFVTGNHEYYSGADPWLRELERLGVRPLENERVEIAGAIDLAGINDVSSDGVDGQPGPDHDRALDGWDRERRPIVLLAHQPIAVAESAARGVDLQLSGHTHGGQLFPFHGLVRLEQPFLSGLHRVDDTQVFVTNGAGFWGPPVRVGAPPEIAVVRLTGAG